MILLIDNYDSFSYNLFQLIGSVEQDITVIRNDERTIEEIEQMQPELIVLSPGPKRPMDAGVCLEVVRYFSGKIPILGVCLGHQSICEAYGATITYAKKLMHGKSSIIKLSPRSRLFRGINEESHTMQAARYHSLVADRETIPNELKVIAVSDEGEVMAVEHESYPVFGVQFHPESVLTKDGIKIIENVFYEIRKIK
ncbi:MAG: aminodeoxychorismate/anthranilate synthase component II [Velocimicrobium sp.]